MTMAGKINKTKGRIKKTVGKVTRNRRLKNEGMVDMAVGKIKSGIESGIERVKKAMKS